MPLRLTSLRIRDFHPLRCVFPGTSARDASCDGAVLLPQGGRNLPGLGSSPFARHYWGNHCLFSLPAGTKMFQFPAFASPTWLEITSLQLAGLSHSEILGSKDICSYPRLIAAYHVLHRLREPRHPPDALTFFRQILAHTFSCKLRVVINTLSY